MRALPKVSKYIDTLHKISRDAIAHDEALVARLRSEIKQLREENAKLLARIAKLTENKP
jgi:cell division protein FtsB